MSNFHQQQKFLGVVIDNISRVSVMSQVDDAMKSGHFLRIATVNPAFLLMARNDVRFRKNLSYADIRIVDGRGVSFVSRFFGRKITYYAGADLFFDLLTLAQENNWATYFYCHANGLSQWRDVQKVLQKKYPKLTVDGEDVDLGVHQRHERCKDTRRDILVKKTVGDTGNVPQLFFINFGAPMQEYFAEQLRASNVSGVAIGVGGSFDFLTGKIQRAPIWMQRAGIEWLYRLWRQPWRVRRIWESVVVFPVMVLWEKIISKKY